ncbi:MAG: tol-pal system protein YbgF [Pseudomonadota bacterium]
MMKSTHFALCAMALAASALLPLSARAGLLEDDEARKAILELRAKVDKIALELNARIDTKSDKTAALDLVNQQEQTAAELAKLRGQVEVLSNELANAQKRQKDFYADLDGRLRKLEPQKVTVDGREVSVDPNEQKTFDAATQLFKNGDYKNAAAGLADFTRRYPESGYAAEAQYRLGNSYFLLHDYQSAIAAQQVVANTYADSPKAPDALLNIGICYIELKDKKNARKFLQMLMGKYPESSAAQTAKQRLAVLK